MPRHIDSDNIYSKKEEENQLLNGKEKKEHDVNLKD
jgi:hypothetical protein